MKGLLNGLTAWKSTVIVLFLMALVAAGVIFKLLSDDVLLVLIPLVMALFKDWLKEKPCTHKNLPDETDK